MQIICLCLDIKIEVKIGIYFQIYKTPSQLDIGKPLKYTCFNWLWFMNLRGENNSENEEKLTSDMCVSLVKRGSLLDTKTRKTMELLFGCSKSWENTLCALTETRWLTPRWYIQNVLQGCEDTSGTKRNEVFCKYPEKKRKLVFPVGSKTNYYFILLIELIDWLIVICN